MSDDQIIAAVRSVVSQRLHAAAEDMVDDLMTDVVVALLAPELVEVQR